jgi:hypothetical protein
MVLLHGKLDVFVGQPLLADNPAVHLQLTQVAEHAWKAEFHNPTDQPLTVTVKVNPFFDPLQGKAFTQEKVTIPAGASVWRDL